MIENLGTPKSAKFLADEWVVNSALRPPFLTIGKILGGHMRSRALRKMFWSRELISVVLLCIN